MISEKNNLPINKGVIIIAGPDNKNEAGHMWFYVVDPNKGHYLDMNNNIWTMTDKEAVSFWVCNIEIRYEDWWEEYSNGIDEEMLNHSGICAGCEDDRF